jgi:glycosyltransferase involved in cell wall biosynthesis
LINKANTKGIFRVEQLRAISIWRKELVNLNKVRDNHFRYFGSNFDFTLLVSKNNKIGNHIEKDNAKVVRISGVGGVLFFYFRCFIWLVREHYKNPFDALIAPIGEEPIGWLFVRLLFWRKPKLIYDLWDVPGHSVSKLLFYNPKKYFFGLYYFVLKRIIKKGDVVIVGVVPEGMDDFHITKSKIIVSQNSIQPESFPKDVLVSGCDEWKWVKEGFKKILYVGYIHKTRGSDLLIDYALYIKNHGVLANIIMVGPSDDVTFKRLHEKIVEYGVEDIVHIYNELPSLTIPGLVAGADIGVCALDDIDKYRWSYPVKIYEYLVSGKPVVATDLPGISTIITNGSNGLLFNAGDTKDFINKINSIINNKDLYANLQKSAILSVCDTTYERVVSDISQSIYAAIRGG